MTTILFPQGPKVLFALRIKRAGKLLLKKPKRSPKWTPRCHQKTLVWELSPFQASLQGICTLWVQTQSWLRLLPTKFQRMLKFANIYQSWILRIQEFTSPKMVARETFPPKPQRILWILRIHSTYILATVPKVTKLPPNRCWIQLLGN